MSPLNVAGDAAIIVTGDKALLALREYKGVRVITLREYLDNYFL